MRGLSILVLAHLSIAQTFKRFLSQSLWMKLKLMPSKTAQIFVKYTLIVLLPNCWIQVANLLATFVTGSILKYAQQDNLVPTVQMLK